MPVPREDVLELLLVQDRMANRARDVAGLVLGRSMAIPEPIAEEFLEFVRRNVDAAKQARKSVRELDELFTSGFRGAEVTLVERLIEEHAHKFFKRTAEHASNYWLGMIDNMEGIIIGGPGHTKDQVLKGDFFHHEIAKLVRKPTFDVGYSNESGLRELVQRAGGLMHEIELDAERQLVNQFLSEIMQQHPKATYGEMMVRSALEQGAVDTLLLSEGLRKIRQAYTCRQCQHGWQITADRLVEIPPCPSCSAASDQIREDPENTITLLSLIHI